MRVTFYLGRRIINKEMNEIARDGQSLGGRWGAEVSLSMTFEQRLMDKKELVLRSGGRMFQVDRGAVSSTIHTNHPSLHPPVDPTTICFSCLSIHPSVCPSNQEALSQLLPDKGVTEMIWPLPSRRRYKW